MKALVFTTAFGPRLYPIIKGASKQILPIYDRPMVHEPISGPMMEGESEMTNKILFQINGSIAHSSQQV